MTPVSTILNYVADAPKSATLYSKLLGSQPVESSQNFAMFVLPNGTALGLWARHDVKAKTFGVKRYDHPQVGRFDLHWESLKLADPGQTLVTYTPVDAASETALELLGTLCREEDRGGVGDDDRVLEVRRR